MRKWEIAIYRVYDRIIDTLGDLLYRPRGVYKRIQEAFMRNFEYYLSSDGKIKIRRSTGSQGIYAYINKKLVKIAQGTTVVIDDMSLIGWKECDSGKFDEDLGVPVESKQHYKQLMKEKGLVPLEPSKYCGSSEYRRKKLAEFKTAKIMPTVERKFAEAYSRYGNGINDN